MNFDVNSEKVMNKRESVEICTDIMEDILNDLETAPGDLLNDLLDNLEEMEGKEATAQAEETGAEMPKTFFKTLSFFDDPDDDPSLPFESFFGSEGGLGGPLTDLPSEFTQEPEAMSAGPLTEVPSEFTQPFTGSQESSTEATDLVTSILDAILDAVPPRKIATVHPFSLNNKDDESETTDDALPALRLAGFATDPAASISNDEEPAVARPTIKFANFAVDPSNSSGGAGSSRGGGLKLANFAVDPDAESPSWHTRDGAGPSQSGAPPPLTHRPDQGAGSHQVFSPPLGPPSRSPALPSLTRAPNSTEVGATPPPPSSTQNLACFGHFERELEYRYCFRWDFPRSGRYG